MRDLRKLAQAVTKMTPLPHQERVQLRFDKDVKLGGGLILNHDTGTGKTFSSIYAAPKTGKPLVAVVPAALRENYKKELEASGFTGPSRVMSYNEAIKAQKDPTFRQTLSDSVLVYDEAHRMGREGSEASKLSDKLKAHKKLLLTGTPIRNHPTELVPLLRAVTNDPTVTSLEAFRKNYIHDKKISPSLLARIRGVKSGKEEEPKNLEQLAKILHKVVDVQTHEGVGGLPSVSEERVYVPMSKSQHSAYDAIQKGQPSLAYKIRQGIPPSKQDFGKYKAFLTGLRQVSNTPEEFQVNQKVDDAPKIMRAADEVENHYRTSPTYRGYSYSNYLKSGVSPLQKELERRGIKTGIFTGKLNDKEKKQLVKDYNSGKIQHLLISSSGAEGLDLKGTKLIQILEPHWNTSKIHQVRARGVRYKSHDHLPESDRSVHIQEFFSHRPQHPLHKMLGMNAPIYADEYIHNMASRKDKLNNAFLKVLRSKPGDKQ